jgi:hypothetical protein
LSLEPNSELVNPISEKVGFLPANWMSDAIVLEANFLPQLIPLGNARIMAAE